MKADGSTPPKYAPVLRFDWADSKQDLIDWCCGNCPTEEMCKENCDTEYYITISGIVCDDIEEDQCCETCPCSDLGLVFNTTVALAINKGGNYDAWCWWEWDIGPAGEDPILSGNGVLYCQGGEWRVYLNADAIYPHGGFCHNSSWVRLGFGVIPPCPPVTPVDFFLDTVVVTSSNIGCICTFDSAVISIDAV